MCLQISFSGNHRENWGQSAFLCHLLCPEIHGSDFKALVIAKELHYVCQSFSCFLPRLVEIRKRPM